MFGLPPATLSRTLHAAEKALLAALQRTPKAAFLWPSAADQVKLAQIVQQKNPLVRGRWGFVDGKNYRVEKPTDADLQNAYYNG